MSRVARYCALNATARPELRGGARKVAENYEEAACDGSHQNVYM